VTLLQIIVLALVQGVTEYLPVSSSAHLILVSYLFDWPDQGLVLDVAVHLGTLFAVIGYFRRDLADMALAWRRPAGSEHMSGMRTLVILIIWGSIPVMLAGWLGYDLIASWLRNPKVIAVATVVFGVLLWLVDARAPTTRDLDHMDLRSAVWIGFAQIFALIPGVSRSGVTITMGRLLGLNAEAAARFSFLLSIPVIAAAGGAGLVQVLAARTGIVWQEFGAAVLFSGLAGWVCIAAFLAMLKRVGLVPFVIYRLLLGAFLLYIAF
jgi:undecaprenyl-diphosphatase